MRLIVFILLVLTACKPAISSIEPAPSRDRCAQWVQSVRTEHIKYFGLQFPYWYGVGQLQAESSCRPDITAPDGGQGIAQFMPKTEKYLQSLMGEALDPYNPKQAIRMQAFYMHRIHTRENWSEYLWVSYACYNSGAGTVRKERDIAGTTDYEAMRAVCRRKVMTLSGGGKLNLCDVGYSYPKKVYAYGAEYRRGADGMPYWN